MNKLKFFIFIMLIFSAEIVAQNSIIEDASSSSSSFSSSSNATKNKFIRIIEDNDTTITLDEIDTVGFKGYKQIDSVVIETLDPFADTKKVTKADIFAYGLLDKLHVTTRNRIIKRNLLFVAGDSVSNDNLIETERILRSQKYLADASIRIKSDSSKNIAHVKTSDKWTLSVPVGISNESGEDWQFLIGLRENNFLGLGQNLGFYYQHQKERDAFYGEYATGYFFFPHISFKLLGGKTTDGYFSSFQIAKPFLSRSRDEMAFTAEGDFRKFTRSYYTAFNNLSNTTNTDANLLSQLNIDSLPKIKENGSNLIWQSNDIRKDTLSYRISFSKGNKVKNYFRIGYDYMWEFQDVKSDAYKLNSKRTIKFNSANTSYIYKDKDGDVINADTSVFSPYQSHRDSRISLGYAFDVFRFLRLKNYHRIKWTEDINIGFQFFNIFSKNFKALGAHTDDWRMYHKMLYTAAPNRHNIFTFVASTRYYVDDKDYQVYDMYNRFFAEYVMKPNDKLASVIKGSYDGYYNTPNYRQLYLGGDQGLLGYPFEYLVGQNRILFELEQRFFPDFELFTLVPVFSAFVNAGNVFPESQDIDLEDLLYTAGMSLNLGLSKSVDGVINKLIFSWPLNGPMEDGIKGFRFAITAVIAL